MESGKDTNFSRTSRAQFILILAVIDAEQQTLLEFTERKEESNLLKIKGRHKFSLRCSVINISINGVRKDDINLFI